MTISIAEGTPGAKVYYTINGTTPTAASTLYSAPIVFSNTSLFSVARTLTAVAVYPGGNPSAAVSANYTILSETTPVGTTNSGSKFMGLNVIDLQNNSQWPLATPGAVRFWNWANQWMNLNPSRGVYNWANLDNEIAVAQSHGVPMLFTFGEVPPWAITQGLGVTSIVRTGGVVTVTTAAPHVLYYNPTYLPADQTQVVIAGVGDGSFNGTFSLTATPSATTLQYAQAGADASSSGGTLSAVCSGDDAPASCAQAPMQLSDWQDFVTALIHHVGPNVIHTWEGWNEANISNTWRGDPAYLVQMVNAAHGIIHGVDANAVVLSPSTTINFETPQLCATMDVRCGSTWMSNWLAAGGATAIDGVAIHTYPGVGEAPEQVQGQLTLLKVAMNQNGVGSLPIVDTESSWGLDSGLTGSNDQVAYLGRHFLLLHSMGVQGSYWYAYDDSLWGTMWNSTTGLNAAGEAYNFVYKWIVGSTVTKPCAPIALGSTTYSCSYTRAGGYTGTAVWDTSGSGTYAVPTGYVQYRDLYGDLIAVGGATVPLTASPILLENKSAF